jgi:hypothetical protein
MRSETTRIHIRSKGTIGLALICKTSGSVRSRLSSLLVRDLNSLDRLSALYRLPVWLRRGCSALQLCFGQSARTIWGLRNAAEAHRATERLVEELAAKPSHSDIVLMHDDHPYVGQILEGTLPYLAAQNCDLSSALDLVS